jgi:FkbM family methyltransferase
MSALAALGRAARLSRRIGLERPLDAVVGTADLAFLRLGRPPLAASVDGIDVHGYLRHRSFLAHVSSGMYEPFLRSLIDAELRPGVVLADCGAHIGLYSALACSRGARAVAFEPDPYNAAALRRNVAGCDVRVVQKAVADRTGRATFHAFAGTIAGSLVDRADRPPGSSFEAELTTLDVELAGEDLTDLVVKVDVEGAEPLALAGMRQSVVRAERLALVVEVNPEALSAAGSSPEELVAAVLGVGLECWFVDEAKRDLEPVRAAAALRKGNLLCRKAVSSR